MGIAIGDSSALAGAGAAQSIGVALLSEVQASETASVESLFGSLGLGANVDAVA